MDCPADPAVFDVEFYAPTRENILNMAAWMERRMGVEAARAQARAFALTKTVRGRDFWFAVTEILGGDTAGWRTSGWQTQFSVHGDRNG